MVTEGKREYDEYGGRADVGGRCRGQKRWIFGEGLLNQ